MEILEVILKPEVFDAIESGKENEFCRFMNPTWIRKMMENADPEGAIKHFDVVRIRREYSRSFMFFEITKIRIGTGRRKSGETDEKTFVVSLGDRLIRAKDRETWETIFVDDKGIEGLFVNGESYCSWHNATDGRIFHDDELEFIDKRIQRIVKIKNIRTMTTIIHASRSKHPASNVHGVDYFLNILKKAKKSVVDIAISDDLKKSLRFILIRQTKTDDVFELTDVKI